MDFQFTEAQESLRRRLRKFGDEQLIPRRAEFETEKDEFHPDLLRLLLEQDIYRHFTPAEYGGHGIRSVDICIIREELCRACCHAEDLPVMQGIGSYPIAAFGNEEQRRKYLPPLAEGKRYVSFCLTELGAGSDVAGIESTARLEGDYYYLNGTKIYVANPGYASVFVVFAKTAPELKGKGISAFIVEKDFPGITMEALHCMPRHPEGKMVMRDCRVPKENLLGEAGRGMSIALGNLSVYRTTVGAASLGMAQSAFEEAVRFSKDRRAFERTLADFQAIQFKLAEMQVLIDASRLLVYRAAWKRDQGQEVSKEASIAKYFATENAQKVVDEAVQIFGGRGVWEESRVAYLYKAVRPPRIYEGTSEIQKMVIAREILKAPSAAASVSGL